MSNALQDAFDGRIRDRYKVQKLEVETEPGKFSLDLTEPAKPTKTDDTSDFEAAKQKYGVSSLQCEGLLGFLLHQRTLADATCEDARQRMNGMKLATATVTFQKKPVRLWYEISI